MVKIRRWIAYRLVRLARFIYPQSEEVLQFWSERFLDFVIEGKSNMKITVIPDKEMH